MKQQMSEKMGVGKPMLREEAIAILSLKIEEGQETLQPEAIMEVSCLFINLLKAVRNPL